MRKVRILRFENLKFNNKKGISYSKLKRTPPFNYVDTKNEYFSVLFEGLVTFLQTWDPRSKLTEALFKNDLYDAIEEAEIHADIEIEQRVKQNVVNSVYNIYHQGIPKFNKFRGEVVEYLVVLLFKDNYVKIYQEPEIKHKKELLIQKEFLGKGCKIDVVNVHKKGEHIKLIECKADLDVKFDYLFKQQPEKENDFKKKINNMNHLYKLLSQYRTSDNNFVLVEKVLAAIKQPKREIPSLCSDFRIVNLLYLLQEGTDLGRLDYLEPFKR